MVVPFSNFGIGAVSMKFFAILLPFFVVRYYLLSYHFSMLKKLVLHYRIDYI